MFTLQMRDRTSTMDDQTLTFVFIAVGFMLLGVELMLPTGGLVGVMCISSFLASAYFAYRAWSETAPLYWRIYMVTFLVMIPTVLSGIYYLLTKTAFGNRVLLAAPTHEDVTPYQTEHRHLESLIGKRGRAISPLSPGGLVTVDGERLHAIGEGFGIELDAKIEVVAINGTRVIVREVVESRAEVSSVTTSAGTEIAAEEAPRRASPTEIVDPFLDVDKV